MGKNRMQRPHMLVCHEVERQWLSCQFTGFWQWLLSLGEIKPLAIEIIQTKDYDKKHNMCEGGTINRWRYDKKGFQAVPANERIKDKVTETCEFCIDSEQKRLLIVWANILGSASSRKKIQYFHTGTLYEMVMNNGIEDYDIISTWIE